ncbi:ArsR/SmtB family transcription factor [Sanguibacter suaedae]|uniref:Helix-turn-helix domain-containing protein n=1 Tax=Sanguibacter suaedae TaxID=2795737 RepID=A0A934MCB7_9MICO|nr:helix-turn-helix domain-containing protein [Sanguibacter suaedae]MBI9116231.1 helix-turn-helix domain-containing protein [Sanguibacter suaedae]
MDTASLRALAHPVRLKMLAELRSHGPATVGRLAERLGLAAGSASYHLRTLAEHGLVVELTTPPDGHSQDRRTRWWDAAHRTTTWEPGDHRHDPEAAAASRDLEATIIDGYRERALAALDLRPDLPAPWQDVAYLGDDRLTLTLAEAEQLRGELEELLERWSARPAPVAPAETRPVMLVVQSYPDLLG